MVSVRLIDEPAIVLSLAVFEVLRAAANSKNPVSATAVIKTLIFFMMLFILLNLTTMTTSLFL